MTNISADAHARREAARVQGRFGEQERTEEEVSLAQSPTALTQQVDLRDIRSMSGDEIDALDDRELWSAYAASLVAADRLRQRMDQRGLSVAGDWQAAGLRIVDLRDPSEVDYVEVESAARRELGVAGTTRSETDFYNYLRHDLRESPTMQEAEELWAFHRKHGQLSYASDETLADAERRAWTNAVEDSLEEARKGRGVPEDAYVAYSRTPTDVERNSMVLDERQVGDTYVFAREGRLADGSYLTTVQYVYVVDTSENDEQKLSVVEETERFTS